MKLILMLVAIYSLIFHQLYKEEKALNRSNNTLKNNNQYMAPSGEKANESNDYANGFLFSVYQSKTSSHKGPRYLNESPLKTNPFVLQVPLYRPFFRDNK